MMGEQSAEAHHSIEDAADALRAATQVVQHCRRADGEELRRWAPTSARPSRPRGTRCYAASPIARSAPTTETHGGTAHGHVSRQTNRGGLAADRGR